MPTVKSIEYPGLNKKKGQVLYVVIGNRCTFTGVNCKGTSTINAAEQIMRLITEQEDLLMSCTKFYDLQTSKGYISKPPGQYDYDELQWYTDRDRKMVVHSWAPAPLSVELRALFADQIS